MQRFPPCYDCYRMFLSPNPPSALSLLLLAATAASCGEGGVEANKCGLLFRSSKKRAMV
jgi:hypothetical protein